jgi:ZIP family zinc transporter
MAATIPASDRDRFPRVPAEPTLLTVFVAALVTALATGLGAVPFLFVRRMSRSWLGTSNALAAGFMAGASGGLLYQGASFGPGRTALGALAGVALLRAIRPLFGTDHESLHLGSLRGADARKAFLIIAVMTAHSFTEGVGVGVSFGGGEALGLLITIAIAIHNIPEGLAISLVLVPRGARVWQSAWWSIFSSLPQPLMAVPAFAFVEAFEPLLPVGLGFAAGAMLWLVGTELVPDALEEVDARTVALVTGAAAAAMLLLQALLAF